MQSTGPASGEVVGGARAQLALATVLVGDVNMVVRKRRASQVLTLGVAALQPRLVISLDARGFVNNPPEQARSPLQVDLVLGPLGPNQGLKLSQCQQLIAKRFGVQTNEAELVSIAKCLS